MSAASLPTTLPSLTVLRFAAAAWVLTYHFRGHLDLGLEANPVIAAGWLGVDLFFVLSGFILTHVYLEAAQAKRFDAVGFLWARLARVYPLHLATLAAMGALFVLAQLVGRPVGEPAAFNPADIPAHLTLTHAWGVTAQVGWNFPSWSISAEWAAYLAFPALLVLTAPFARRPLVLVVLALALLAAATQGLPALYEQPWSNLTAQGGVWRILPLFLLGLAVRRVAARHALTRADADGLSIGMAGALAVCVLAEGPAADALALVTLPFLIYALAQRDRTARTPAKPWLFLGEASYALYMTHLLVDIVAFTALGAIGLDVEDAAWLRALALVGVMGACLGVASLSYLMIEKPARGFLRARDPRALFTPRLAPRP